MQVRAHLRRTAILGASALGLLLATGSSVHAQQVDQTSPAQLTYAQISTTAQQVALIAADPLMSVESKTAQITTLANQFNQSVATWQQQVAAASPSTAQVTTPPPTAASSPSTAQVTTPPPTAASSPSTAQVTPPPPSSTPPPAVTPDQLRTQIAQLSQQMASIAQDRTLSADSKNAQLSTLSTQFNQLMQQLQQLGG